MDRKKQKLNPEKFEESSDHALNLNALPNEMILKIFGYLEQNQLGQIARVCSKWNELTKSPLLWEKVSVKFPPSHRCQSLAVSLINRLPSCVTSIMLNFSYIFFTDYRYWIEHLDFGRICLKLQEKCPHLKELVLTNTVLSSNLSSVIDLCIDFLQDIKKLTFNHSVFHGDPSTSDCCGISKIKILELDDCCFNSYGNRCPFSKMPHLEQLHLFHTRQLPYSWFEDHASFLNQLQVLNLGHTGASRFFTSILNHAHNLKELYLCLTNLLDHDLTFTEPVFPHLKTICLTDTSVTCGSVVSLIQSCPSLEIVYVDGDVAELFATHPFVVANRIKAEIVKAIGRTHNHDVVY